MITKTEPEFFPPRVRIAQTTGCDHQAGQRSPRSKQDSYDSFVENATQEAQNEFYAKLARILLNSPPTASGS